MRIKYKYIGNYEKPKKQTVGSAGIDLFNNTDKDITIKPGEYAIISTGFYVDIPKTTKDIINEGKALHHCVGVYVDKVVRREDMIYFLRKDKNIPYVTIEVKDKKVTQVEGDMNNRFISKGSPEYNAIKEWAALNKFGIL